VCIEIQASTGSITPVITTDSKSLNTTTTSQFYSYEDIKNNRITGINFSTKEQYLTDEEFYEVFKMTKSEFSVIKDWKKVSIKKSVGLF
jgi:hypothetical protein